MTIQIPDDLTRGLESLASIQRKTVEEVAVEGLRLLFKGGDSPAALLMTLRSLPHPSAAAVDEMEAAIAESHLPVRDKGAFDNYPSQ